MTNSRQLLTDYAENGSDASFRTLVARYIDLVYSTAFRLVDGDTHRAEEVAQTVFLDLSRMASGISENIMLGGWLHRHTCFVAAKLVRGERRRQLRESHAVEMNALNAAETRFVDIAPILDEAINELGDEDRKAIVLRFYEQYDLRSVGEALGSSENAAQKRVTRALDQLHLILTRQGIGLSAAALGATLAVEAVTAAPAGLAAGIAGTVLAGVSMQTGTTVTLTKALMLTKAKLAVLGAVLVGVVATPLVVQHQAEVRLLAKDSSLQEQLDQLGRLTVENEHLSNLVAQASSEQSFAEERMRELLRLRGEVTAMRTRLASLQNGRLETTNGAGETLHVRTFRINPRAFLEKADSALGHPINSTPTQITADYFASKGINLEPPKSAYLNTSNALLIARATDPELNAIESLLAESTPAQINIEARFIEIPRQGFVMPSAIPGIKDNKTTGVTGILGPTQFRVICKGLEQTEGVNLLTESSVTTLSGRQCQIRTGDDAAPGQPATSGPIVDLIPNLSADGYTIKLKATVSAPETLNGEVNMYDHQTLLLSTTEKTKPDSQLIVLLTATLVDPVGNPVHADDELPFAQNGAPPQN